MSQKISLYKKLHTIQSRIMGLGKDKSANSYKYVTGDKVLEHVKPLMNELGLILKQELVSIENTRQDYRVGISNTSPEGRPKSEVLSKVMMKFTWVDTETGDTDENLFGANGQNDWDKGVGSALTYGERYFLLKYFHIATDEDDIDNPERKKTDELVALPDFVSKDAKHHVPLKTPIAELEKMFTLTPEQKEKYIKSIQ
jgi:hypothetical protein